MISVPVMLSSQSVTAVYFRQTLFHVSMFADDPLLFIKCYTLVVNFVIFCYYDLLLPFIKSLPHRNLRSLTNKRPYTSPLCIHFPQLWRKYKWTQVWDASRKTSNENRIGVLPKWSSAFSLDHHSKWKTVSVIFHLDFTVHWGREQQMTRVRKQSDSTDTLEKIQGE